MKTILITGADSFVGSHFLNYLRKKDAYKIIAIGRKEKPKRFNPNGIVSYIKCDIFSDDIYNKLNDIEVDICVHFAWDGVSGINRYDAGVQTNNAIGTFNLVKVLSKRVQEIYWNG